MVAVTLLMPELCALSSKAGLFANRDCISAPTVRNPCPFLKALQGVHAWSKFTIAAVCGVLKMWIMWRNVFRLRVAERSLKA